ncbi:hypothetical protein KC332_g7379 [Hortaea werneckii]|nr:hypothetical protein KC358_g7043 [Hortaea werneckii]KAI6835068.1 hypothetical protein KC350_g6581 [Hortaea werneckii]KAI6919946.1 hypothetical protein KC348_g10503 [Hortaea werneckii]KAI6935541.1 hypothetical protein KC341_g6859 [Hortaea werneckii]KAI6970307.1 hypothetical protein KC321_g7387 [Hortaea werneckii]
MQFFLAALALSAVAQAAPTNRRDVGSIVDTAVGATQDGTNNVVDTTETLIDGVNKNLLGATSDQVKNLGNIINQRAVGDVVDTAVGATQEGTDNVVQTAETLVDGVNKNLLGATSDQVKNLGNIINQRAVGDVVDTAVGATQDGTDNVVNTLKTLVNGLNANALGATADQVDNVGSTISQRAVGDVVDTAVGATQDGTDNVVNTLKTLVNGLNTNALGATAEQVENVGETVSQ